MMELLMTFSRLVFDRDRDTLLDAFEYLDVLLYRSPK